MIKKRTVLLRCIAAGVLMIFVSCNYLNSHFRNSNDLLKTRNRTEKLLHFCKETDMSFVIDNTCTTKAVRKWFLDFCSTLKIPIHKKCIYFDTPIDVCIKRNQSRTGKEKVPEIAIYGKAKEFEIPELAEGFDELIVIKGEDQ